MADRPLVVRVDSDDLQVLNLIAAGRRCNVADLAGWLLATWVAGPGRDELRALAGATVAATSTPRTRTRRPREMHGQLSVDDAIAATG